MNEELLSYYWKLQKFHKEQLCTTDGEEVQVIYPGLLNQDAGPDFLHARIRIGETLWVGNVELHSKSSDWIKHGHDTDPVYDSIILHVVYDSDMVLNKGFPELELKHFIDESNIQVLEAWQASMDPIPCAGLLIKNPEALSSMWMERLLVERFEMKAKRIEALLIESNKNWESTFYQFLAHYFGLRVNALPFEILARATPWRIIRKHQTKREELEALLMGQAGLLQTSYKDGFHNSLKERYRYMKERHQIIPMQSIHWKFLRLRPANFPTLRISQFADFLFQMENPLNTFLECETIRQMESLFEVNAHEYWQTHTKFGIPREETSACLGVNTRQLLLGNAVLPFLFVYSEHWDLPDKREWVLEAMHELRPENNALIRRWKSLGISAKTFGESQSLFVLSKNYCEQKHCLNCEVGNQLLSHPTKTIFTSDRSSS